MARCQVLYWRHIPAQVRAWDGAGEVKRPLPARFQAAIDERAMRDGATAMDDYLEGWRWGPEDERPGPAAEAADHLVAELDRDHPRSRLLE